MYAPRVLRHPPAPHLPAAPPLLASFIARSLCSALVPPPPTGTLLICSKTWPDDVPPRCPPLRPTSSARALATWYALAAAAEPDDLRRPRDEGRGDGGVGVPRGGLWEAGVAEVPARWRAASSEGVKHQVGTSAGQEAREKWCLQAEGLGQ